jgi:hypothetical protein
VRVWSTSRSARSLLLAVAAGLCAAGCGSTTSQQQDRYLRQFDRMHSGLDTSIARLRTETAQDGAGAQQRRLVAVGDFQLALAQVDHSLRRLRAPVPIAPLQRQLLKRIDRVGAELRLLVRQQARPPRRGPSVTLARLTADAAALAAQADATATRVHARLGGP